MQEMKMIIMYMNNNENFSVYIHRVMSVNQYNKEKHIYQLFIWINHPVETVLCTWTEHNNSFSWCSSEVPGTAENARSCVRAYFADLHETLCRQEEMALSVVDAHVRERLIWLRQQQEDMTILLSQVSTACLHCEKTLQQVCPETPECPQSPEWPLRPLHPVYKVFTAGQSWTDDPQRSHCSRSCRASAH